MDNEKNIVEKKTTGDVAKQLEPFVKAVESKGWNRSDAVDIVLIIIEKILKGS